VLSGNDSSVVKYRLPDGSRIWLNAKSKIRFGDNFKTSRTVYLIGEAYFEIANDTIHPFQVRADKSIATVVGTKFNIRSFLCEDRIELTVNEGKVLFGVEKGNIVPLVKGQTGILDKNNNTVKAIFTANLNNHSWRTHDFIFEEQTFVNVLNKLAEVYNFQYHIKDTTLLTFKLTAKFHNRPLPEIIETLEAVTNGKIGLYNGIYIVKK
jgi:ferric-dicitrate binding protein FerR (iron transport regulator)